MGKFRGKGEVGFGGDFLTACRAPGLGLSQVEQELGGGCIRTVLAGGGMSGMCLRARPPQPDKGGLPPTHIRGISKGNVPKNRDQPGMGCGPEPLAGLGGVRGRQSLDTVSPGHPAETNPRLPSVGQS